MSTFDTIVIMTLGVSLLYSIFRGMIKEIFSILSIVIGYVAAVKYNNDAAEYLKPYISTESIARVVGFVGIYLAATLVVGLIGYMVRKLLHKSDALSLVDRLIGGFIGLLKGVILVALVLVPLQWFPDFYKDLTKGSQTAPELEKATLKIKKLLNVDQGFFEKGLDSIKDLHEKMPDLDEMKKLSDKLGDLKGKADELLPEKSTPQDTHSKKDQEKLEELVRSVTKE